ncbi:FAD-binding oxidoreductase [Hyphomonas sp. CACIAM 19H1]|uniref:FAD-dependent oxidoreductase n=1 Tax=Hyphomonas sp. CACIAM 19H1 TaxID=1873716 RepID=UPI000DEDB1C1|nr:FAD-dependent oxidoreductase [Hyphomonas sp. CACIAM 19H1]AXE64362.1 FAD-binding oxidoreductase [Hyphomonas sp. CACIAM 19H1]
MPHLARRTVLLGMGASALAACASQPVTMTALPLARPFPKVLSQRDRITRTVVGLRPFRPQGFRLEAERFGDKTVIHNYGHGGCGVTLSWGTSQRAAVMAGETGRLDVAILGGGVMGLTSALILARRGHAVTVYAELMHPNTTSNIAGALWLPSSLYDRDVASEEFLRLNWQVTREAHRGFLPYVNRPGYGVSWVQHSEVSNRVRDPRWALPGGDDLYPDLDVRTTETRFGFPYEERYHAMMIDPDYYLDMLMKDAQLAGAKFIARRFETLEEVLALPQPVVANCTGLGAAKLFGDETLMPIRGQLSHLLPQPEIDYSYTAPGAGGALYMFPRKTGLVLGGSHGRGDFSMDVSEEELTRMIDGHAALAERAAFSTWVPN